MNGADLIKAERKRQVIAEGWSSDHDDSHDLFELTRAAICYARAAAGGGGSKTEEPGDWPWTHACWKPKDDEVRMLTIAGALIAAEIDRLLREQAEKGATA